MFLALSGCGGAALVDNEGVSSRWRKLLIGVGVFAILVAGGVYWLNNRLGPGARTRVIQILEKRFNADVELASLHVSLFPNPEVVGEGLTLRHKDWPPTAHPMFAIRKFTAFTTLSSLFGTVKSVSLVQLEGLQIHLPPKGRTALKQGLDPHPSPNGNSGNHMPFVIDRIVADGTLLEIEPKVEGKEPLQFDIGKLTLHSVGPDRPMAFDAILTNPKPPGLIQSSGSFGPWNRESPRDTPVSGKYTFENADLGVFKGISGILSSTGSYQGVLERIEAQGTTDTPDFRVSTGGHPVDLKTTFSAVIDGTNGDTLLQPVVARFRNTVFECRGGVTGTPGIKGKTVSLDIKSARGRMEDLLWLTVKADKPLLTGESDIQAKFLLPPGPEEVMEKLQLDGKFSIKAARFSSRAVAEKITQLSLRAQGRPQEISDDDATTASNFAGTFALKNGTMRFSRLSFAVPGAMVNLAGSYGMKTEQMNFDGSVRMQAHLSQMVTGFKSVLLKVVDPFFAKDGAGTVLPIKISGTRNHPEFGVSIFHKKL